MREAEFYLSLSSPGGGFRAKTRRECHARTAVMRPRYCDRTRGYKSCCFGII